METQPQSTITVNISAGSVTTDEKNNNRTEAANFSGREATIVNSADNKSTVAGDKPKPTESSSLLFRSYRALKSGATSTAQLAASTASGVKNRVVNVTKQAVPVVAKATATVAVGGATMFYAGALPGVAAASAAYYLTTRNSSSDSPDSNGSPSLAPGNTGDKDDDKKEVESSASDQFSESTAKSPESCSEESEIDDTDTESAESDSEYSGTSSRTKEKTKGKQKKISESDFEARTFTPKQQSLLCKQLLKDARKLKELRKSTTQSLRSLESDVKALQESYKAYHKILQPK